MYGVLCLAGFTLARADVTISIGAETLESLSGMPLPPGTLIELVNLGADGVFDPIDVGVSGSSPWVSGDDTLVTGAEAFDGNSSTPGLLDRTFTFDLSVLPVGTKLGIRWFPGLEASQFSLSTGPTIGQSYGEFTRQSAPINGGDIWVITGNGVIDFDPLVTASSPDAGADPDSAGVANLVVVPEPTSGVLSLAGGLLAVCRRRRPLRRS